LSAVVCLGRWYGLVAVLRERNAIGAYGFLAKAHIGHAVVGDVGMVGRAADIEARLSVQAVADLDRRVGQNRSGSGHGNATRAGERGHQLGQVPALVRGKLAAERIRRGKVLADLQVARANIEGEWAMVEADLAPMRYLATLMGAGEKDVQRHFTLIVALLLDPSAVLLLLAALSAWR
jgi:hypothetical protein